MWTYRGIMYALAPIAALVVAAFAIRATASLPDDPAKARWPPGLAFGAMATLLGINVAVWAIYSQSWADSLDGGSDAQDRLEISADTERYMVVVDLMIAAIVICLAFLAVRHVAAGWAWWSVPLAALLVLAQLLSVHLILPDLDATEKTQSAAWRGLYLTIALAIAAAIAAIFRRIQQVDPPRTAPAIGGDLTP